MWDEVIGNKSQFASTTVSERIKQFEDCVSEVARMRASKLDEDRLEAMKAIVTPTEDRVKEEIRKNEGVRTQHAELIQTNMSLVDEVSNAVNATNGTVATISPRLGCVEDALSTLVKSIEKLEGKATATSERLSQIEASVVELREATDNDRKEVWDALDLNSLAVQVHTGRIECVEYELHDAKGKVSAVSDPFNRLESDLLSVSRSVETQRKRSEEVARRMTELEGEFSSMRDDTNQRFGTIHDVMTKR
mgnify:FL=1